MRDRLFEGRDEMNIFILLPPRRIKSFLRFERELGHGGFGTVFRGSATDWGAQQHPSLEAGRAYAVKKVTLPDTGFAEEITRVVLKISPRRHAEFLRLMQSPQTGENNIIRGHGTFAEINRRKPNTTYSVMELLDGPDLYEFISSHKSTGISDGIAAKLTQQMFTAIHYLQRVVGVIHRDIKPENFGFTHKMEKDAPLSTLKLFDFGLAHPLKEQVTDKTAYSLFEARRCGTAVYMAPEGWDGYVGPPSDIWAVGVIVFLMLGMQLPFNVMHNLKDVRKAVKDNSLVFEDRRWAGVSDEAKELVCGLLEKDPASRPMTTAIISHAWLDPCSKICEGRQEACCQFIPDDISEILPQRSKNTADSLVLHSLVCATEQLLVDDACSPACDSSLQPSTCDTSLQPSANESQVS